MASGQEGSTKMMKIRNALFSWFCERISPCPFGRLVGDCEVAKGVVWPALLVVA